MSEQQPIFDKEKQESNETPVRQEQSKSLTNWQQAIAQAQDKFLSISGSEEKTKIELGFAVQLVAKNPQLQKCDARSIFESVINVARTGITLNPVYKLAHLVPRGGKCVLDFDYKGLVKILKDNGCIKDIQAIIVYEDEDFEEGQDQLTPPHHKRNYSETEKEHNERKKKGVYSRVLLPDNTIIFTPFMPAWEILKTKNTSKAASSQYSPWNTWEDEMWKKTKIKRDFKTLIAGNPGDKVSKTLEIEEKNNGLQQKYIKRNEPIDMTKEDFLGDKENS